MQMRGRWIFVWPFCVAIANATSLQEQMETYVSSVSAKWGNVGVGVGYVDEHSDFGIGVGLRSDLDLTSPPGAPFTANDTVVLGSGTKPFVAAAVMRLVDEGKVALADKAAQHIDPVMLRLWNVSFVGLLGAPAGEPRLKLPPAFVFMPLPPWEGLRGDLGSPPRW
jgi:CubicO group peptidase (beta-lactamase class C family)